MWLGSDWPPWMVPVITGCFPGLGLSSSSSFPIIACVTARAWVGRRSLLQGLGHISEKTRAGARTSEPGSRRGRPGSGVSAALSCSGATSDAGLRAEASGRVRSQGGHGSERKDQPGGVDWRAPGAGVQIPPGRLLARPRSHSCICVQSTSVSRFAPLRNLRIIRIAGGGEPGPP